jgi:hypothetical protein
VISKIFLLKPIYLITLSALASTSGGIVTPICFAAFKLMMNSNFVGCSTGRSAGFATLQHFFHELSAARVMLRMPARATHQFTCLNISVRT